ncbi:glycosyltransferase family 2 protein [Paenirhodobacter sp.]|uniref:glycosyltransferase family 2 protein n=1 Tax=Paenirhodobacter sp. TaxID=1965326 RepID=UPI003B3C9D72
MALSLIIPVWNDLPGLDRLLRQVADMEVFCEVIIADDASDEAPGPHNLPAAAALADRLVWLRSDRRRGAGHARNMALARARGDHVIFFDSDDLFAADFPRIAEQAALAEPFDFLIFRHHDSRILDEGGTGMLSGDEKRWQALHLGEEPALLSPSQARGLVQVAAYPWNKICRTAFLRDNAIRCTETMVHNDVELHWSSFIVAERILASGLIGATHFVTNGGNRLTNRRSAERLEVFGAFRNVMGHITATPDMARLGYLAPFARFSADLLTWIAENIEPDHGPGLRAGLRDFYLTSLDHRLMSLIAYRDPELAGRINRFIIGD